MRWKLLVFPAQKKQKMPVSRNFLELKFITNLTALYSRWKTHEFKPKYRMCPIKEDTHCMHTRTVKAVCQSDHLICAATKISAAPAPWS